MNSLETGYQNKKGDPVQKQEIFLLEGHRSEKDPKQKGAFLDRTPPPTYQIQSICVQEG